MDVVRKTIYAVILTVVLLAVAGGLYPTLNTYVTNITTSYGSSAQIVGIVTVIYWILIGAAVVLFWVFSLLPGVKSGGKHY